MTWFSFQGGYGTIDFTGANEKAAAGLGFHGYATEAQAKANPNSVNALQSTELTLLIDHQAGALPGGPPGSATPPAATSASVGSLGTLAGFLGVGKISGTNLVIRGAKIIIGGLLLIIGLVHITGAGGAAANIARKVPLPI